MNEDVIAEETFAFMSGWGHGMESSPFGSNFGNNQKNDDRNLGSLGGIVGNDAYDDNDNNDSSNNEDMLVDPNSSLKDHDADLWEVPKRLAKKAQTVATKFLHDLSTKYDETVLQDEQFQQNVKDHTEEEVAGMKLCVATMVHSDSFVAPC